MTASGFSNSSNGVLKARAPWLTAAANPTLDGLTIRRTPWRSTTLPVSSSEALSTTSTSAPVAAAASRQGPISSAELWVTITIPTSRMCVNPPHLGSA